VILYGHVRATDDMDVFVREKAMSEDLKKLIEAAKKIEMTPADLEVQRQSFAFGNANIENERVTRATVAKAAELLRRGE
jgi:hypothetical protein